MENKLLFAYEALDIANKNNKMLKAILESIEEYSKLGEYSVSFHIKYIDNNISEALKSLGYRVAKPDEEKFVEISWGK